MKRLNYADGGLASVGLRAPMAVKKADAMKKMPAKAAPKKAMPMAAMMAKKPVKMAYGGKACGHKGMKKGK